ncbi:MAG: phosphatidylglycerophosphatase A [Thermodesulfobacteriota bacterium]|nr:phosphatidylglycerophosphatase A [Thermodesulfobacteriota bacterium]
MNCMRYGKTHLDKIIIFLATGGYCGFFPFFPGTIGTFVAVILYYLLYPVNLNFQITFLCAFILLAIPISHRAEKIFQEKDAPYIVIDEFAGFFVSMFLLLPTYTNLLLAFLFFRFFDIIKLPPISFAEKRFTGGLGVVMDDVLAGIYTNFIIQVINHIY